MRLVARPSWSWSFGFLLLACSAPGNDADAVLDDDSSRASHQGLSEQEAPARTPYWVGLLCELDDCALWATPLDQPGVRHRVSPVSPQISSPHSAAGVVAFTMLDGAGETRVYAADLASGRIAAEQAPGIEDVAGFELSADGSAIAVWGGGQLVIDRVRETESEQPALLGPVSAAVTMVEPGFGPYGFLFRTSENPGVWVNLTRDAKWQSLPPDMAGEHVRLADGRFVFESQETQPKQIFVLASEVASMPPASIALHPQTTETLGIAPVSARAWVRVEGEDPGIYAKPIDPGQPCTQLTSEPSAKVVFSDDMEAAAACDRSGGEVMVLGPGGAQARRIVLEPGALAGAISNDGERFVYLVEVAGTTPLLQLVVVDTTVATTLRRFTIREGWVLGAPIYETLLTPDGSHALIGAGGGSGYGYRQDLVDLASGVIKDSTEWCDLSFDKSGRFVIKACTPTGGDGISASSLDGSETSNLASYGRFSRQLTWLVQ